MNKLILIAFFLFFMTSPLMGQSIDENEFAAKINRLNSRLSLANQALKGGTSDLELAENQKELLVELRKRHQLIVKELKTFGPNERDKAKQFLFDNISRLETELTTDILLPHQVEIINEKLFERQLSMFGGNLFQAMLTGYRDQLGLDDKQLAELKKLSKETSDKLAEAKARFQEEVDEIKKDAKKKLEKALTEKQLEVIAKAKGNSKK